MDFSLFLPNMAKIWSQYWKLFLFTGLKNTLILTFISVALGTVLGTLVAMLKMSKSKILRFIASVYVEVLRGTPPKFSPGITSTSGSTRQFLQLLPPAPPQSLCRFADAAYPREGTET